MPVKKWSVSVEEQLAERVERRVGDRGLSGFVARAVEHAFTSRMLLSGTAIGPKCGAMEMVEAVIMCRRYVAPATTVDV